jgi:hypothetical protein
MSFTLTILTSPGRTLFVLQFTTKVKKPEAEKGV